MEKMQSRASATSLAVESVVGNGPILRNAGVGKGVKEWPSKLSRIFCLFIALGAGLVVGVISSLHVMGVLSTGSMLSSYVSGGEQLVHRHVMAPDDSQSLRHGMGDKELLWRASMVPMRPGMPFKRIRKVAFMFLTVGPLPLAPLWEKFFKGHQDHYNIYVHSLPEYVPDEWPSSVFYGRRVPSQEVKWGDISMNDAERRLLANALLDLDNERFVLLSESCAPLRNFTFTHEYLMNSNQSFVGVFDDHGPVGRGRYDPRMEPEITIDQWRKGAQWFEVNRELAVYIIADTKYYEKFHQFCQGVCYADEHYIPTMMFIEFEDKIAQRSVTAMDWSRGGSHPGIFGRHNAASFYKAIRGDQSCTYNGAPGHACYLFARKFSPDGLEALLQTAAMRKL